MYHQKLTDLACLVWELAVGESRHSVSGYLANHWFPHQSLASLPVTGFLSSLWLHCQSLVSSPVIGFIASHWFPLQPLASLPVTGFLTSHWLHCQSLISLPASHWFSLPVTCFLASWFVCTSTILGNCALWNFIHKQHTLNLTLDRATVVDDMKATTRGTENSNWCCLWVIFRAICVKRKWFC